NFVRARLEIAMRDDDDGQPAFVSHARALRSSSREPSSASGNHVEGGTPGEDFEEPLEILGSVERNFQLALHAPTTTDTDVGAERPLQLLLELPLRCIALLVVAGTAPARALRALHLGLDVPHAPAVLDRLPCQVRDRAITVDTEQRARMASRKATLGNQDTDAGGQLQQTDRVGDRRAVLADDIGDLLLRQGKFFTEPLVRLGLFQ